MALAILTIESEPIPRKLHLHLKCDGGQCPTEQKFIGDSHVTNWSAAMVAGWLERKSELGRTFLCPGCSGKRS